MFDGGSTAYRIQRIAAMQLKCVQGIGVKHTFSPLSCKDISGVDERSKEDFLLPGACADRGDPAVFKCISGELFTPPTRCEFPAGQNGTNQASKSPIETIGTDMAAAT